MTLKTDMTSDLAVFFNSDEFAQSVIYNTTTTITAVVELGSGGGSPGDEASICVQRSDVSAPSYRDTFTIDGDVWYVCPGKDKNFILEQDADVLEIRITKDRKFSAWRP